MHKDAIEKLKNDYPALTHIQLNEPGVPQGDWLVIRVRPRPPKDEIQSVICDIERKIGAFVLDNGTLIHSKICACPEHIIDEVLITATDKILDQEFCIAFCEIQPDSAQSIPIAISLDPEISYLKYPRHPHISSGFNFKGICYPDHICFSENPSKLGNDSYSKMTEAITEVCMWLFRHQVWQVTFDEGSPKWIGPEVKAKSNEQFLYFRDPYNHCYCGSTKPYFECHLQTDFNYSLYLNPLSLPPGFIPQLYRKRSGNLDLNLYHKWWKENRRDRQISSLDMLRYYLIK